MSKQLKDWIQGELKVSHEAEVHPGSLQVWGRRRHAEIRLIESIVEWIELEASPTAGTRLAELRLVYSDVINRVAVLDSLISRSYLRCVECGATNLFGGTVCEQCIEIKYQILKTKEEQDAKDNANRKSKIFTCEVCGRGPLETGEHCAWCHNNIMMSALSGILTNPGRGNIAEVVEAARHTADQVMLSRKPRPV